ncbi:phosphoglycerate mutase family protein [Phaeacidiphilus oryzae]|uniref:phosphoglycerate mutase family protein n=1 Tax=Phaeacidiphilus oryzae TaxID=348818 RepID=UPI00389A023A
MVPVAAPDWEIAIARNGATAWTEAGRFTSHADICLSRDGWCQAEQVANSLRQPASEVIVASDLGRARCTAQAIARAAVPRRWSPGSLFPSTAARVLRSRLAPQRHDV